MTYWKVNVIIKKNHERITSISPPTKAGLCSPISFLPLNLESFNLHTVVARFVCQVTVSPWIVIMVAQTKVSLRIFKTW